MTLLLVGITALTLAQQDSSPDAVYRELKTSTYWTHPSFNGKIDISKIKAIANDVKPYEFRLLAIPQLGGKWVKNGKEQRLPFAKYLSDQKLPFGDKGIILVLTKKGLSAYSKKLTIAELSTLNDSAAKLATANDFTPAITSLAR